MGSDNDVEYRKPRSRQWFRDNILELVIFLILGLSSIPALKDEPCSSRLLQGEYLPLIPLAVLILLLFGMGLYRRSALRLFIAVQLLTAAALAYVGTTYYLQPRPPSYYFNACLMFNIIATMTIAGLSRSRMADAINLILSWSLPLFAAKLISEAIRNPSLLIQSVIVISLLLIAAIVGIGLIDRRKYQFSLLAMVMMIIGAVLYHEVISLMCAWLTAIIVAAGINYDPTSLELHRKPENHQSIRRPPGVVSDMFAIGYSCLAVILITMQWARPYLLTTIIGFCAAAAAIVLALKNRRQSDARVLIDILIMVFCMVVIGGLALPTIGASREKVRRITCFSNLKQIGLAMKLYAGDNKGYFPDKDGAAGFEILRQEEYLSNYKVYICPSTRTVAASGQQPVITNYEYRGGLTDTEANVDQPLAWDKNGNHKEFVNVLFCDGHVESMKLKNLFQLLPTVEAK